ncbi:MAG TPA: M48 family metallopeptidase [Vicinamibacterales bacterium]|nr:M48 family metallopeptidase [Vicinamibacterales bacterium]
MATDFFERQDAARRNTTRLVVLFVLAVLAIMVSIHAVLAFALGYLGSGETGGMDVSLLRDPGIFVLAFVGTLVVVGGGSLFKVAQLSGGGRVVAEQLDGRLLSPDTADPAERQLMNVVEEMAIAGGTTAPPVYLMEEEGINAFAAGFSPGEAVIGVTRGAARQLSRDELQGVIAHEFSHILNGDMRLNIRLIGLLHGILIIGMLGYFVLRMTAFSGHRVRRSRDQGNAMLPLLAIGAGLMVVGFFGTFFGNLIKAAVSRQREYLADAAAVQFTRQPEGIAGALKKIGGVAAGSTIQNPNAPEASHMFFGRATSGLSAMFSTHPPLGERIRRIDPSWDGTFPEVAAGAPPAKARPDAAAGFAPGASTASGRETSAAMYALDHVGQPTGAHIQYAARLLESLSDRIRVAAHEPYGARALVYTLLLDRDAALRQKQLQHLERAADPGVFEETLRLVPVVAQLEIKARLPVVEIALPALRLLTTEQYRLFKQNVALLVEADADIDLFEWSLQRILLHDLEAHHGSVKPPRVRHRSLGRLQPQCEVLLSMLAYAGHRDAQGASTAFDAARQALGLPQARLRGTGEVDLSALDAALSDLEEAAPQIKRRALEAAVACIAADREIMATEAELLRAISASLGVPMPPLLGV